MRDRLPLRAASQRLADPDGGFRPNMKTLLHLRNGRMSYAELGGQLLLLNLGS